MPKIPIVPRLQEDELLYSYICRMSKLNIIEDVRYFVHNFLYSPMSNYSYNPVMVDTKNDLYVLISNLDLESAISPIDFYLQTSMFSGFAPLMTRVLADAHVAQLSRHNTKSSLFAQPKPFISNLKICPCCAAEELETLGFYYFHRAHQMPKVSVCYKHGCHLEELSRDDFWQFAPQISEADCGLQEKEYAVFCKDFLDAKFQCDIGGFKRLVAKDLGSSISRIKNRIKSSCRLKNDHTNLAFISGSGLFSGPSLEYTNIADCLTSLFYIYNGNIDNFRDRITASPNEQFFTKIEEKYELISPWREDIVELRCFECGGHFIASPHRILSGWGCPREDDKLSDEVLFKRVFDVSSNGEYKLLTPFKGMCEPITVEHSCGREYNVMARSFIKSGTRCPCTHRIGFSKASANIAKFGNFELVWFNSKDDIVRIKALDCGHTFEFNYHKFLKAPYCKICEPRIHDETYFKRQINDLVGDEYTLVGKFCGKNKPVQIRHNSCGIVQKYYPKHFLSGSRCSTCSRRINREEFLRLVNQISCGRYRCIGAYAHNLVRIKDTYSGNIISTNPKRALQELYRPTPSYLLPLDRRNLSVKPIMTKYDEVFEYLIEKYDANDMIFLSDIQITNFDYSKIKRAMQTLEKKKLIFQVDVGIYALTNKEFSDKEIVEQKYIHRCGKYIGYFTDHAFAYQIGLSEHKPRRIGIATNMESNLHGRNIKVGNIAIKLHGCPTKIDSINHNILALMSYLINEKRLKCTTVNNRKEVLRDFLYKNKIELIDFEPFYGYFPRWVKPRIAQLY